MPDDKDHTQTWDNNRRADKILGPEGGVVIWLDRHEGLPRAAIRRGLRDPVHAVMDLALLGNCFEDIIRAQAVVYGIDLDKFIDMIGVAKAEVKKHATNATRIKKSKGDEE